MWESAAVKKDRTTYIIVCLDSEVHRRCSRSATTSRRDDYQGGQGIFLGRCILRQGIDGKEVEDRTRRR